MTGRPTRVDGPRLQIKTAPGVGYRAAQTTTLERRKHTGESAFPLEWQLLVGANKARRGKPKNQRRRSGSGEVFDGMKEGQTKNNEPTGD